MSTFDLPFSLYVLEHYSNQFLNTFFSTITHLGDGWFWTIFCIVLLLYRPTRNIGLVCLAALIIDYALCEVIKVTVARLRPFQVHEVQLLISAPRGYSFPSNHSSTSFAVATGFFMLSDFKPYSYFRWFVLLLAFLIAFSRVYLFVHYISDIVVGAIIGSLVAFLCVKLYEKNRSKIDSYIYPNKKI